LSKLNLKAKGGLTPLDREAGPAPFGEIGLGIEKKMARSFVTLAWRRKCLEIYPVSRWLAFEEPGPLKGKEEHNHEKQGL
jgi:hypothetical protein